ncbi:MAG TPA: transporter substrate-binding domain-containing protein [Candidatus Acidoferrum sp.]|nr:transporter substrate-binding domain-containing protein [Candidatus Acidoferrum sp.]
MNLRYAMPAKAIIVLLLLLLNLIAVSQALADGLEDARRRGSLLVGVKTDFPPFGYIDRAGKIQGFDVEIARVLARALFNEDGRMEPVPVTSGSRIPFLYSEWIDLIIATMTITEERRQVLEFSEPYFLSGSLLLVPKDSPIKGLEDLAQKSVGIIEGAIQEKDFATIAPAARRVLFRHVPDAVQALKQKRLDAFCQDDVLMLTLAKENPDLRTAGKPFLPRPYAIAARKGELTSIRWVNEQLVRMKKDGTYDQLWQRYFGEFGGLLTKP